MKIFKLILFVVAFLLFGMISYSSFLLTGPMSSFMSGGFSLISLGLVIDTIEELK